MHIVNVKGILSSQNRMNLYRGCQHGCIYCDSRSRCYHMAHAFEDVEVKANALMLLESALRRKAPCMLDMGSMSDPYLPLEAELCHTRQALALIARYGFGVSLITKSPLVLRDLDILRRINAQSRSVVQMTLTTCNESLCRLLEPNVASTRARFETLQALRAAELPTVVWLCPILPFLNDTQENLNGILDYCAEAGVTAVVCFGMGVTLREGNREYFYAQLDRHFPGLKDEYIRRFGAAYFCESPSSASLMRLFHSRCERAGMMHDNDEIFRWLHAFARKQNRQLSLFDLEAL